MRFKAHESRQTNERKNSVHQMVFRVSLVAEMGFEVCYIVFVQICFGLFAIFRSDTKNYAIFDPDFCGELVINKAIFSIKSFHLSK